MSTQVIGKKIERDVLFNIDGQPIDQDVKPLKFVATPQPQFVTKPQSKPKVQPTPKSKTIPKKPIPTAKTERQPRSTLQNITNHQKSTHTKSPKTSKLSSKSPSPKKSPVVSPKKSPIASPKSGQNKYREQRTFKPLSQQFPNLMGILFQEKKFTEDVESDSSDYSDDDNDSRSHRDELIDDVDEIKQIPKPERNPQADRDVATLVNRNNKQFKVNKIAESQQQINKKQQLLEQRQKMKEYGKKQIVRAHTLNECYEQKYAWGVNQSKLKEDQEKQNRLQEEKRQQMSNKNDKSDQKLNLGELFPESQGKESKYRKIWRKEAELAVDKKKYSLSAKRTESPDRQKHICQNKKEQEDSSTKFKQDFNKNAKQILEKMKQEQAEKTNEKLLKKHKIDYIDREAKQIISTIKKEKFVPKKKFNNNFAGQSRIGDLTGVKELFENAEEEQEMPQIKEYQKKVKNGQVITQTQYNAFKEDQKVKKEKITKFKSKLNDKKYIRLKNPEQFTEKEQKVKQRMDQEIDIPSRVEQVQRNHKAQKSNQQRQQQKPIQKTEIEQPDIAEFIFAEAELPKFNDDYQIEERMGFREQVEQEIKEQILKQKKKRTPIQQQIEQPIKRGREAKKPQSREKPKYRSQSKLKHEPRYPLYHDLGEVCMLEEDMYNAQHSNWQPQAILAKDSSSEEENDKRFVQRSGFYNTIKTKGIINTVEKGKKQTYSKSVQPKEKSMNKKVYFREPDEGMGDGQYLTEQKEKLMKIVEQQKMRGQQTSDDDSDPGFVMQYSSQIWLPTDPVRRDIFVLSSKELMELAQINI